MLLILILAIVLVLSNPCCTQTITLSVEPQKGCSNGALASEHTIKLICTIYFGHSTENWSTAVVINITKTSGENKSIVVDPNSVTSENRVKDHTCRYIDKGTYIEVTCEIIARKDLSAANVIAYIGHLELGSVSSGNEKFPYIFDREDIRVSFNGHYITSNSCAINISPVDQDITVCCDNSPSPCAVEIRRNGGALLIAHEKCAAYRDRPAEGAQYELSFHVCDEPTPVRSIVCNTTVTTEGPHEGKINWDPMLTTILILTVFILAVVTFDVCRKCLHKGNSCWPFRKKIYLIPQFRLSTGRRR